MIFLDAELGTVRLMGYLRFLSAAIEFTAALYIVRLFRVEDALRVNALLGLVGPAILVLVTLVGLAAIAERVSAERIVLISLAVILVFVATR